MSNARLIQYRMSKAHQTLEEVAILFENELWNTAVNRLYYASYYAVTALLISQDTYTKTHGGARQMFGLHFIRTGIVSRDSGRFYSDIFDKRQAGDYDDFIDYERDEVISLLPQAIKLVEEIQKIIK